MINILFPLILTLTVQFNGGYGANLVLYPRCGGVNRDIVFYLFLLPMNIIVISIILMLVNTLWNIADVVRLVTITKGL